MIYAIRMSMERAKVGVFSQGERRVREMDRGQRAEERERMKRRDEQSRRK